MHFKKETFWSHNSVYLPSLMQFVFRAPNAYPLWETNTHERWMKGQSPPPPPGPPSPPRPRGHRPVG